MRNHYLHSVPALIGCLLAACGGGGGGQGSDFGGGLAINVSTLSFSGVSNGLPPPAQSVLATISASDAALVKVGYTAGNEQVPWLQAAIHTTPGVPATVNFSVIPWSPPGTYTAHPSIGIFRSDDTPIAVRTLTVTYQVLPQPASVSSNAVAMVLQAGTAPAPHQVFVNGNGTWTATVDYASGAGWLQLGSFNTFPQTGPANTLLNLSPVSTTPIGSYSATLHVAIDGQTFDIAVTLDVVP
jgi:hypothetical protein